MNKFVALVVCVAALSQTIEAAPAVSVPYFVVSFSDGEYPIVPYQRVRRSEAFPGYYGGYGGYGGFQPGYGGGGFYPGGFGESQSSANSQASSQSFSGGFGDVSSSQSSSSASSSSEGFFGKR